MSEEMRVRTECARCGQWFSYWSIGIAPCKNSEWKGVGRHDPRHQWQKVMRPVEKAPSPPDDSALITRALAEQTKRIYESARSTDTYAYQLAGAALSLLNDLEKERAERAEERRAWAEYIGFLVARVRDIDRDCYGGASKAYYESAKQKLIELGVPEDDLP